MAKLLENTFRAVKIGLVNEFEITCDRLEVDVGEVIDAAGSKPFGFMQIFPGPGLGGHCIPVDPHYLAWKLRTVDYNARFIQLATEVDFGMPEYVMNKISEALDDDGKALKNSKVTVLGVTYKPDVEDLREAPALHIIHLLHKKRGAGRIPRPLRSNARDRWASFGMHETRRRHPSGVGLRRNFNRQQACQLGVGG